MIKRIISIISLIILYWTISKAYTIIHQAVVPDGYIPISTIEGLYDIRNNLDGKYILMKDLDFDKDSDYLNPADTDRGDINGNGIVEGFKTELTTGGGWEDIGGTFAGTFDGNNYSIRGLYTNRPSKNNVGLFSVSSGTIKNLKLYVYKIIGAESVGGIVGYARDTSNVINCSVEGSIYGTVRTGGIAGYNNGNLYTSYFIGNIVATTDVGGVIGRNEGDIENCYAIADIKGTTHNVAGLVGIISDGVVVSKCYSMGNVAGTDKQAGGLVGDDGNSLPMEINNSIAMNKLVIGKYAGIDRVVGSGDKATLNNNYGYKDMRISTNLGQTYVTKTSNVSNTKTGKDITLDDFKNPSFYQENLSNWDFTSVWELLEGAIRPTLINNPDGIGINYPDNLTESDRKNFKYYIVKGYNGKSKIVLVSRTGKDTNFERADILDQENRMKSGIYYIDDKGNIRKYNKYYDLLVN